MAADGLDIGGNLGATHQRTHHHNQRGIITANPLRLRTFGGLWIEGLEGPSTPGPPPTRLALLALLAAAGPRGLSRDRLLGILWPEGADERGRHALAQTVYSLRRDLGNESAVVGTTDLRLDPSVLSSDVGDLTLALQSGDGEAVARLYVGPFLDGFYLSSAPEFERWAEVERSRLAAAVVKRIEQLAESSEREGRRAEALGWWRRLTELDPLRGRFAAAYMQAVADTGDRAGALAHARSHESALRHELEASPEGVVTQLVSRLRAEHSKAEGPVAQPLPPDTSHSRETSHPPARATSAGRRVKRGAAILTPVLALAAFLAWRATRLPSTPSLPLLAVGSLRDAVTRDTTGSGGVLTDMLATSLARIKGLQVVANSRLLELISRGNDTVPGALTEAARRAGAQEILEGELGFASDGGLRLQVRRIDLVSGVLRHGYSIRAFDRYAAVDSATAAIAQDFGLAAPAKPIAEVSTSSPIAYRFYEEGLRAYYEYDVAAAYRLMQAALQEDSSFAMAAYYALRSGATVDPSTQAALFDQAIRLAPRAPERERLLILGTAAVQVEDPAARAAAESLAIRFPADLEGQELYGVVLQAQGDYPGAISAYRRAVTLDSAASLKAGSVCHACEALHKMYAVYLAWDSFPAAERALRGWARFRPAAPDPLWSLAEIRWRQERWAGADSAMQRADSLSTRRASYEGSLGVAIRRGNYDEFDNGGVLLRDPDRALRSNARWLWLIALRNQGRLREALALDRDGRVPGGGVVSRASFEPESVTLSILAFESGDYAGAIRGFRAEAEGAATIPAAGHRARGVAWNLTHAGAAYAAAGDTATVRRLADSIETIGPQSLFGRGARLHHFLRGLLLAAGQRHAEAVEEYRRAMFSTTEGYTRINYELARSLLQLHRPAEALEPLRAALHGGLDGSNLYITRTELHELLGQAFVALGRRDSAAVHYRLVARAWEKADPLFQARRSSVLDWLKTNAP